MNARVTSGLFVHWPWLVGSALLSALVIWLALRYAQRANLLDMPGQRRSHSVPTPRGGGIGIVVAVLAGLIAQAALDPAVVLPLRLLIALSMIALIGWIDDHRPLPALVRLLVHFLAVIIWLAPLIAVALSPVRYMDTTGPQSAVIIAALTVICVGSINLHNFMDGIDGLLALQALFVFIVLGVLCLRDGHAVHTLQIGIWAAAVAAFVPFNFPRARVFMGDVGSGAIGMLIAVAAIWQYSTPNTAALSGVLACSAFVVDGGCTLLSRIAGGRRWYRAHREHLYQWMVRAGMSHVRVAMSYMLWNLCVVVPLVWWLNRPSMLRQPRAGVYAAAALYLLAIGVWWFGKRRCLQVVKLGDGHAHA